MCDTAADEELSEGDKEVLETNEQLEGGEGDDQDRCGEHHLTEIPIEC